jgi:Domain of unknown function (DUF4159)
MTRVVSFAALLAGATVLWSFQKPFREYPAMEYSNFPLPDDYQQPAEFVFARMMYPNAGGGRGGFGFGFGRGGDWHQGYTNWTNDYPRSDRHLMVAFRRLTRIDARSVEQPVNLEDGDDVFNWPFLYAARAGSMWLTDEMTVKLREYLDRGGFLVLDDMWGDSEYETCVENVVRVFPGKTPIEIEDADPVFHTVFDLDKRYQISGEWSLRSGVPYLNGGVVPHWQGIWDDNSRRMRMAVWVNNDTGDSWEWADDPRYPERYSALGIRITVNHAVYAMTH